MIDHDLEQIIAKARTLKRLRRARERVRQLERELGGQPLEREEPSYVPEFLRAPSVGVPAGRVVTYLEPRLSRHSRR